MADAKLERMNSVEAKAIAGAVADWAIVRDDIRALALAGSWARGNPHQASDIDLLLLSDRADEYRGLQKWLSEIDFTKAGYRIHSSNNVRYGVVWSLHIHLLPKAEVELTFAKCSWARTDPVDSGTRCVVKDAFCIIFDKDGILTKLVDRVASG